MKIYIDSANVSEIGRLCHYYPISGVTTNPNILIKENRPYMEVLKEIRAVIGNEKELFVQALGDTTEEIIEEGRNITNILPGRVILKVPATEEGIKAIKILSNENIPTLATTIYTAFQALVAAMAGANYVAPYVNRIDNINGDGTKVVSDIVRLFKINNLSCQILAASFKNAQQVTNVVLTGADSITVPPELLTQLMDFPSTKIDVMDFKKKWQTQYGKNTLC